MDNFTRKGEAESNARYVVGQINGITFIEAAIQMVPQNKVNLDDEQLVKFNKLYDMLDELDDVQEIFHNVELPEEDEEE